MIEGLDDLAEADRLFHAAADEHEKTVEDFWARCPIKRKRTDGMRGADDYVPLWKMPKKKQG